MEWVAYVAVASLVTSTTLIVAVIAGQLLRNRSGEGGGTSTPETVAFWLVMTIAEQEGKKVGRHGDVDGARADRRWVLDTFAECMLAIRSPEKRIGTSS